MTSVYADALTLGDAPLTDLMIVRRRGSMENVLCRGNALTEALEGRQEPGPLAVSPECYARLTKEQHDTLRKHRIAVRPYHTLTIRKGR